MISPAAVLPVLPFVIAYAVFVFVAEIPNPFTSPKAPIPRSRWRFGRHMGFAAFLAMACVVWLRPVLDLAISSALIVGVVTAGPVSLLALRSYRKRS